MTHRRITSAGLAALLILAALTGAAIADGPVLWKQHCPRHHDVSIVPADDWGGVNVMCVRAAEREVRP